VTADYVGPSRRTSTRPPEDDEIFEVPNMLRARVTGDSQSCAPETIEAAWRKVLRWKMIRLGRQLESSARMMGEAAFKTGDPRAISSMIDRIAGMAGELCGYARQTEDPAYWALGEQCATLGAPVAASAPASAARVRDLQETARTVAERVRQLGVPKAAAAAAAAKGADQAYFMV
jgi:hypothetical protein